MKVVQIVPGLPPAVCGIGDHALRIGRLFREEFDVSYCALRPEDAPKDSCIHILQERSASALVDNLKESCGPDPAAILLHFSGYGYARWGLCFWLLRGLREFLRLRPDCRLLTMFHELWAEGPPWTSTYWIQPAQRYIAKQLFKLSHCVRTNRAESKRLLAQHRYETKHCTVLPVFSNLGELREYPAWETRNRDMILFQPPSFEDPKSSKFWDTWKAAVDRLEIRSTIVAGSPKRIPRDDRIKHVGFVSETMASNLLSTCRYSLLAYYPGYFAKSSILAAMAAHGVACIAVEDGRSEADGITAGEHYQIASSNVDESSLRESSNVLWQWYQNHSILRTSESYSADLHRLFIRR